VPGGGNGAAAVAEVGTVATDLDEKRSQAPVKLNRLSSMSDRNSFGGLSEAETSGSEEEDDTKGSTADGGPEPTANGNDLDSSLLSDGDETIMDARGYSRTLSSDSESSEEGSESDGSEDEGMDEYTRVLEDSPGGEEAVEEADDDIKKLQRWLADKPNTTEREAELVLEFDKQLKVMKKLREKAETSSAEKAMLAELVENMDGDEGDGPLHNGVGRLQKLIRDATRIKRSLDDARREQHRLLAQSHIHSMDNQRKKRDQEQVNEAMECVVAELQDSMRVMSEQQHEMRRKEKQQDDHIQMLYQTLTDVNAQHAATDAEHQSTIAKLSEEIDRYKSVFSAVNSITEASSPSEKPLRTSSSEPRRLGSATISKPKPIRGKGALSSSPTASGSGRGSFDLDGNPVDGPTNLRSPRSPRSPTGEERSFLGRLRGTIATPGSGMARRVPR